MRCPTLSELPPPPSGKTGWPWTKASLQLPDKMLDGSEWPKISIVTPNYNYGQFIEETIRSVLLQGYPNLEYIVLDANSTDDSVEIIKKYEAWLSYWVSEPDGGQSAAINRGFQKASGEIYYWINSDDILNQETLKEVSNFYIKHPDCHFLTGDGYFFRDDGYKHEYIYYIKANSYSFNELLQFHKDKYLPQPSVFFSKKLWYDINGLNVNLSYSMDLDFWLRARKVYNLYYFSNCLSFLRLHSDSKTCGQNIFLIQEVRETLIKYLDTDSMGLIRKLLTKIEINHFYAQAIYKKVILEYKQGHILNSFVWLCKHLWYSLPNPFSFP
jgi:glycosyltransferase involved in cell wall biosynthesis